MKKLKIARIFGASLIITGLLGITPTLYYRYKLSSSNAVPTIPVHVAVQTLKKPDTITGTPVSIAISSLKLTVPIVPGVYDAKTKQWSLSLHSAQFATITTPPNNESGDTYIYGHYRPEVFAYLHVIKPDSMAEVTTDNNYVFTYKLRDIKTVDPDDTSVFAYQGTPILTLQTCSGTWFQNRQQYTFVFISYKKI